VVKAFIQDGIRLKLAHHLLKIFKTLMIIMDIVPKISWRVLPRTIF
jgi:hypothetical protein